jgi:hypothetical protein
MIIFSLFTKEEKSFLDSIICWRRHAVNGRAVRKMLEYGNKKLIKEIPEIKDMSKDKVKIKIFEKYYSDMVKKMKNK